MYVHIKQLSNIYDTTLATFSQTHPLYVLCSVIFSNVVYSSLKVEQNNGHNFVGKLEPNISLIFSKFINY